MLNVSEKESVIELDGFSVSITKKGRFVLSVCEIPLSPEGLPGGVVSVETTGRESLTRLSDIVRHKAQVIRHLGCKNHASKIASLSVSIDELGRSLCS